MCGVGKVGEREGVGREKELRSFVDHRKISLNTSVTLETLNPRFSTLAGFDSLLACKLLADVRNRVSTLQCLKFSEFILFLRGKTSRLYTLKYLQNILLIKTKNQGGFQEITVTSFPKKKGIDDRKFATLQTEIRGFAFWPSKCGTRQPGQFSYLRSRMHETFINSEISISEDTDIDIILFNEGKGCSFRMLAYQINVPPASCNAMFSLRA